MLGINLKLNNQNQSSKYPVPLSTLFMPLEKNLDIIRGVGSATFTRSTIGTFLDKDDGLVKTAAIDAARFEANGVLIEGAGENLAIRSDEVDNAAWSKTGGITFAANQSAGADGSQTADQITYVGGQGSPSTRATQQAVTVPGGTASKTFTVSYWLRSVSGTSKFRFNCTHGGVIAQFGPDITATTTLQRFDFTVTNGVAAGNGIQFIGIIAATDDSAYDLYVWRYQFEESPFASSGIKTEATSVTRAADNLIIPIANFNQPVGSVSMTADLIGLNSSANQFFYSIDIGATSKRHILIKASTSNNTRTLLVDTTTQADYTAAPTWVAGVARKVAYTYGTNDIETFVDGASIGSDTSATIPSGLTNINIGADNTGASLLFGHIKNFRIYDVALTANEVARIS